MKILTKINSLAVLSSGKVLLWVILFFSFNLAITDAQPIPVKLQEFPGKVRLILPRMIYVTPAIEMNIYFDNIVLVVNPANYIFDVTCDKGFQYDTRWTFTPKPEEAGDYPITIAVRDESNTIIAQAQSTIRVVSEKTGAGKHYTLLAIGDSHLQKDVYLQHMLDLCQADSYAPLTLIGSRGAGNKPPSSDLRHEGYNGWTAKTFATRSLPKPRTGFYVPAETGSPFIYKTEDGSEKLDFAHYCQDFNNGQSPDFVIIQLGGNDIWNATDDNINQRIDEVLAYYDILIKMIRDFSKDAKIGVLILDPLTRWQHGYRNYNGPRKQTRWQYRNNQHRMVERMIKKYDGREAENIYLVPVNVNLDCVNGFPMEEYPLNARMPTLEKRVYDGAHLSPEGYRQFGDTIYCWYKGCLPLN